MGELWIMLLMTLHARIYHGSLGGQIHRVRSPLGHGTLQLVAVFHDYMQCLQQPEHGNKTGKVQQMDALDRGDGGGQLVAKTATDHLPRPLPVLKKPWWLVYFRLRNEISQVMDEATNRSRCRKSMIIWVLMVVARILKRKWGTSWLG